MDLPAASKSSKRLRRKSLDSVLQLVPCFELSGPKLAKCLECVSSRQASDCRFINFRRLKFKNGQLESTTFVRPTSELSEEDMLLWFPNPDKPPAGLDVGTALLIIELSGDHFCGLLEQEKRILHAFKDRTIAWKPVVNQTREMCDDCCTTIFNYHWTCGKCGFVVCIDCYRERTIKFRGDAMKDRFGWLHCTNRATHHPDRLMLTESIPNDSLQEHGRKVHEVRTKWGIPQHCDCPYRDQKEIADKDDASMERVIQALTLKGLGIACKVTKKYADLHVSVKGKAEGKSMRRWLADVHFTSNQNGSGGSSNADVGDREENHATLRDKPSCSQEPSPELLHPTKEALLDEVISSVIEHNIPHVMNGEVVDTTSGAADKELKFFVRRFASRGSNPLSVRVMTLSVSKLLYPNVPHMWLCEGRLLRLTESTHPGNFKIFHDQWKRGQPIVISGVSKCLNRTLWTPDSFSRDFGAMRADLVNCMTGKVVPNQLMHVFWDGFENFSKRLKDFAGRTMLLKLKDWPSGEDFAKMLPSRFEDLMSVLPMPEYTHRSGKLNLASRLPDIFVRPDLGPKMYSAFGSAQFPDKGTTNLHLDMSDAVNVMAYVGFPKDEDGVDHIKEAYRAIDKAGCDILTRQRVRERGELPGALWHIYHSEDADKIRDFLNKVSVENFVALEPHTDPIHDQRKYLDCELRERLYTEYGVQGYAIVQCLGDSVFIPAGAPHQVLNLLSCIKVAEDFVSPENITYCLRLTQEFRELTSDHANHEDKLQIKSMLYHGVKDSLAVLANQSPSGVVPTQRVCRV